MPIRGPLRTMLLALSVAGSSLSSCSRPAVPADPVAVGQSSDCTMPPVAEVCGEDRCVVRPGCLALEGCPGARVGVGYELRVSHDLEVLRTEVTLEEYRQLLGSSPVSSDHCGAACPVDRASWHEAVAYCNALSEQHGLEPCFDCEGTGGETRCSPRYDEIAGACPGFRLPTGDEWEYSARAGTVTAYYGGPIRLREGGWADDSLDPIAWYRDNAPGGPQPVATKRANRWGLFDMLGNVEEWLLDGATSSLISPAPPEPWRGVRGGCWSGFPVDVAMAVCATTFTDPATTKGFRCVRTLPRP